MTAFVSHSGSRKTEASKEKENKTVKTLASVLAGMTLMIGSVMAAQAPAASTTTTAPATKPTTQVKKHKKHAAKKAVVATPAATPSATPAK